MKRKKSILWKWTLSYLCLFLIPLLSVFINYHNNEKSLREEYINTFKLTLNNLNNVVDTYVTNMKNYQNYILNDSTFSLLSKSTSPDNYVYYNAYKFQDSLSLYNTANTSMNCTIYYSGMEFISSPSSSSNIFQYYNKLLFSYVSLPDYEKWFSFLSNQYNNDYLIYTGLNTSNCPNLIMAHTVSRGEKYSTIFITVPLTELYPLLQLLPDNTFFVIQTSDDQLYFLDKDGQIHLNDSLISVSLDTGHQLSLPQEYVALTSSSTIDGFTCHLVVSEKAMNDQLYGIRKTFLWTLTITLLLGLLGAIILLYINYQPVSKLLTQFNVRPAGNNEFQSISATYEELQKEYHAARKNVAHQTQELMNSWLLSLLKGRINELDLRKKNLFPDIDPDSRVALIGFKIPLSDQQNIEYDELLFFIVNNIFQELFEGYTFYRIEDGRFIYYLFDLKDGYSTWHDFALDKVEHLCNLLTEKWNTSVVGVVSEWTDGLNSCKFLYRKIMESFELQNTSGGNTANFNFIRGEIAQEWHSESKDIVLRIRKYVEENYTDQNLSVGSIADALNRTPKHISRVFKKDSGEGILDYINHYRIDKAWELMQAGNYTLTEVSEMVGYANVQSFRRAFVKITGEVPSKYNK